MKWSKFFIELIDTLCCLGGLACFFAGAVGAVVGKPWGGWVLAGGIVALSICMAMSDSRK